MYEYFEEFAALGFEWEYSNSDEALRPIRYSIAEAEFQIDWEC